LILIFVSLQTSVGRAITCADVEPLHPLTLLLEKHWWVLLVLSKSPLPLPSLLIDGDASLTGSMDLIVCCVGSGLRGVWSRSL